MRVAVEISDTSRTDYEVENIRKCLEAGYDYVVSVCSDEKFLSLLKTQAKKSFSFKERERMRFCVPDKLAGFLAGIVSEKAIVSGVIRNRKSC